MEVVHVRCAGLDISKKDAKVCVRVAGVGRRKTVETVTTWSSMTNQVLALREHLAAERVTCVVMEATGDYWKPIYYLLEAHGFALGRRRAQHPHMPLVARTRAHAAGNVVERHMTLREDVACGLGGTRAVG